MDYIYNGSIKIPVIYYIIAVFAAAFIFISLKKMGNSCAFLVALLVSYVFLVFSSTVLARPNQGFYDYNLKLFWSYDAVIRGDGKLLIEIVFNVIMFVPIGFIGAALGKPRFPYVAVFSLCLSYSIEMCQLIFKKGFFEFDDVFHNTLGAIVGFLLFVIFSKLINLIITKKVS